MADQLDRSLPLREWWQPDITGKDLALTAYAFGERLFGSAAEMDRRMRFLTYASQYVGRPISSLTDFDTNVSREPVMVGTGLGRSKRNLTRTLVDTALSRYAKTETRVLFATDGGTYEEQHDSEEGTDAVNALIQQTGGEKLLRKAALHSCVFDLGVVKTIDTPDGPDPEHVPAWELMFDPADAHRGKPRIFVHWMAANKDALVAEHCSFEEGDSEQEKDRKRDLAADIRESSIGGMITSDHTPTENHCRVFELWACARRKQRGRHVIVTDRALIVDEKWTEEQPNLTLMGWSEPLIGAYPESIAAIVSALQEELDGVVTRKSQILRKLAVPQFIDTGVAGIEQTEALQLTVGGDAIGDVIRVPVGHNLQLPEARNVVPPDLFNEEDRLWSKGFQMTGISEQSAVGSRPTGLNSAPAQREWNEINQDRLALPALDYQGAHVDLGTKLLKSVASLPDYEISIKHETGRWLKRVKASALRLQDRRWTCIPFPIGALPLTPSGKLAAAADLLQAKAIDVDQFQEIVQIPDLKSQLNINLAVRRAVQKLIGKMLSTGQFEAPPEFLAGEMAQYALKYAVAQWALAVADDQPENTVQLIQDWIGNLRKNMEPPAPAPGAAPPGPAPMPPGGGGLAPTPLAPAPPLEPLPQGMAA